MKEYKKIQARIKVLEANPFTNTAPGSELHTLRKQLAKYVLAPTV